MKFTRDRVVNQAEILGKSYIPGHFDTRISSCNGRYELLNLFRAIERSLSNPEADCHTTTTEFAQTLDMD